MSAPAATALQTYNISTLAALIVAACGVPVAKHGNRAASSLSGASDVLSELGVRIGIAPYLIEPSLREANIGFMTAQAHHAAMAHVGPVRRELGARTLFNLLGPLSNPAGVKHALIGVFAANGWSRSRNLRTLGAETRVDRARARRAGRNFHHRPDLGSGAGTGRIAPVRDRPGTGRPYPRDTRRLARRRSRTNAGALRAVLAGEKNAYRDIAVFNAAAALVVAGEAENLKAGSDWPKRRSTAAKRARRSKN